MGMELVHSFTVPADPPRTWELLTDLQQVGGCFPGATVTSADEETFEGEVKVKLGPIAVTYQGKGRFLERDDQSHHAKIEGLGRGLRGLGNATALATIDLAPHEGGTKVDVVTDLSITGKPAQFGRGVMQSVSDKLLGQFVACLESRLAEEP
jgi:carbon monoxide dehydrogenase subunit G